MEKVLYDQTNTIKKLYEVIYNVFGVDKHHLKSRSRRRKYVEARVVFAVIARRRLLMGTVQIGELLNKDHSSISHYTKQHADLYEVDKHYRDLYDMCHKPKWYATYATSTEGYEMEGSETHGRNKSDKNRRSNGRNKSDALGKERAVWRFGIESQPHILQGIYG